MSMKYFTLSALCVLLFCMFLALSGTTDITENANRPTLGAPDSSGTHTPAHDSGNGALSSHLYVVQDWPTENHTAAITGLGTLDRIIRSKMVRLIGAVLITGWVFAGYKFISSTF